MKEMKIQRVINEFEGGPTHLYLGKTYSQFDGLPYIQLYSCKDHPIFKELKITPTIESISQEKMPLVTECEDCEECSEESCPNARSQKMEEVGDKFAGMKVVEVLEGWFVDFSKCTPWKICECCNGKGYLV